MNYRALAAIIARTLSPAAASVGYELATHARLTLEAFNQSLLQTDPSRLQELGIPSLKYTELGKRYFDVRANAAEIRVAKLFDYDLGKMPGVEGATGDIKIPIRVDGWLMRGAVREDDSGYAVGVYTAIVNRSESEPEDDPYLNFNRWCNHFFDPLTYSRLTDPNAIPFCLLETYASAPVWASGAIDPFQEPAARTRGPAKSLHRVRRERVDVARDHRLRSQSTTGRNDGIGSQSILGNDLPVLG